MKFKFESNKPKVPSNSLTKKIVEPARGQVRI